MGAIISRLCYRGLEMLPKFLADAVARYGWTVRDDGNVVSIIGAVPLARPANVACRLKDSRSSLHKYSMERPEKQSPQDQQMAHPSRSQQ
jgi:hypothetical protein